MAYLIVLLPVYDIDIDANFRFSRRSSSGDSDHSRAATPVRFAQWSTRSLVIHGSRWEGRHSEMSGKIKAGLIAGLVVAALTATACSSSSGGTGSSSSAGSKLAATVKIGVPLDLTGSAQITGVGTGEQAGVKFAVDQINSSGFLGTTKIDPVYYDTLADKTQAVARTTQLTTQDGVSAIVGYSLTPSFQAAAPIAQAAEIPTIAVGLSGVNSNVTALGDYLFRELLDYTLLFKTGDPQFVKATHGKTAAYLYGSDTVTTSSQEKARKANAT